jgi:hypothetical protein
MDTAPAKVIFAQTMKTIGDNIGKQLLALATTTRNHLRVYYMIHDPIDCNICTRREISPRIYCFGKWEDAVDLLTICSDCDTHVRPCLDRLIATQYDNYVFQLWALERLLGRDLARVITGYYYIVTLH